MANENMDRKEERDMLTGLLILALLIAVSKWIVWRISFMAVLLYYGECGQELPTAEMIRKYQTKAALKSFGLKGDETEL